MIEIKTQINTVIVYCYIVQDCIVTGSSIYRTFAQISRFGLDWLNGSDPIASECDF
jgi:hypothetical protein